MKEFKGFIQNVPSGYFGGDISKVTGMYPLGNVWMNCLKNLNVSSMYPLGKCPLAPSEKLLASQLDHIAEVTRLVDQVGLSGSLWGGNLADPLLGS